MPIGYWWAVAVGSWGVVCALTRWRKLGSFSASEIAPTPKGKGLTATIKVTVRDSGVTEVNGTPVWTAHPETGVAEAVAALLVEFYKKVDKRKRNLPDGQ